MLPEDRQGRKWCQESIGHPHRELVAPAPTGLPNTTAAPDLDSQVQKASRERKAQLEQRWGWGAQERRFWALWRWHSRQKPRTALLCPGAQLSPISGSLLGSGVSWKGMEQRC